MLFDGLDLDGNATRRCARDLIIAAGGVSISLDQVNVQAFSTNVAWTRTYGPGALGPTAFLFDIGNQSATNLTLPLNASVKRSLYVGSLNVNYSILAPTGNDPTDQWAVEWGTMKYLNGPVANAYPIRAKNGTNPALATTVSIDQGIGFESAFSFLYTSASQTSALTTLVMSYRTLIEFTGVVIRY